MIASETDIIVYAHWKGMNQPIKIGGMTSFKNQNKPTYHFTYNPDWLGTPSQKLLDPTLQWSDNSDNPNVGLFLDSTPDAWGRTLMQKRVSWLEDKNPDHELSSCDYLLEVSDITRTGGLRFKRDENGPFLDQPDKNSIPSLNEIPRLRRGAKIIESWENTEKTRRWLHELLPHSAAIGGARPKTIAQDEDGELWIAKFPSKYDEIDRGLWEYMTWQLAREAGIKMADSRLSPGEDGQHTFLTKRFDRSAGERIHFLSAMTATHHYLEEFGDQLPSYLELADFLRQRGSKPVMDLRQLWRRIVFNIAISNCDDHLRNHGFLIQDGGWRLSPAFDLNPGIGGNGLALNIDRESNRADFSLAKSVGSYFRLNETEMDLIMKEVRNAVSSWRDNAEDLRIPWVQIKQLEKAFA